MAAKKKVKKTKEAPPAALAADGTIPARVGDTLALTTRVKNVVVPYNVSYDAKSVLFSLVSGTTTFPVGAAGTHTVRFRFNETPAEGWIHTVSARINGGEERVLLSGSAAAGDPPRPAGRVFVVVSA